MRQNCEKTALLDKFISGDHAAFCEIYNTHKQQISVFVKRRGAFYSKNSEDIVQNVFQKVYEKRSFFDPAKGSISNWIYTIALRESISFFRKSKKIKLETTVFDAISQIKEVENINIHIAEPYWYMFDSAYPGYLGLERCLPFTLVTGDWCVKTFEFKPDKNTFLLVHEFDDNSGRQSGL